MDLRRNLIASGFASISGMAMQAANAPLYLALLTVDEFSLWVLAAAVGSYLTLTVNGLFYSLMNEITIAAHKQSDDLASRIYSYGLILVCIFALLLLSALALLWLIRAPGILIAVVATLTTTAVNFSSVLIDANFRAGSRFVLGSNILSATRLLDWIVAIGFVALTREVPLALTLTALYRIMFVAAFVFVLQRQNQSLQLVWPKMGLRDLGDRIMEARGQLFLAATVAASTTGPQIIMSSVFPGTLSVTFNVYRTYLRLAAALVTTANAAAWPMINRWYAEGGFAQIQRFLRLASLAAAGVTILTVVGLCVISPYAFPILFHGKIGVDWLWLSLVAAAVVISTQTLVVQSFYQSTNSKSVFLAISTAITFLGLLALLLAGHTVGFSWALSIGVLTEALLFLTSTAGLRDTMQKLLAQKKITPVPEQPQ